MSLLSRRPGPALLADLAVSCSIAGLAAWWWHQFPPGGLLYGCLAGLALMWRRRRPLLVLAVVAVLSAVVTPIQVGGTRLHEGMLLVALAVAAYSVVAHAATLRTAVGGGVAALLFAAVLLETRPSPGSGWSPIDLGSLASTIVNLLGFAAVVWAAGLSARYLRQQRATAGERRGSAERERAQLTRLAVAEERAKIARELHDIVAHSLSVMILQANGGEYAFDHDPDRAREALRTIGATGRDALDEIRQLVQILRSGDGDGTDHEPATLNRITAVVARARDAGLAVDVVVDGTPPRVPGGVALAVYRIVQESLTNTLKHAGPAPSAAVRVAYRPDAIELEVTDTGVGGRPAAPGGHGLVGMRERTVLYGGTFDAGPRLDGGWRVRARIPLADEAVPV